MKTKEELNAMKDKAEILGEKPQKLTEDTLVQASGGAGAAQDDIQEKRRRQPVIRQGWVE